MKKIDVDSRDVIRVFEMGELRYEIAVSVVSAVNKIVNEAREQKEPIEIRYSQTKLEWVGLCAQFIGTGKTIWQVLMRMAARM